MSALLYRELLGRLTEISDRPDAWRELWADEDEMLSASIDALRSGGATVTEVPELDLAVVDVDPSAPDAGGHRFGGQWVSGLHPIALHGATERGALLTVARPALRAGVPIRELGAVPVAPGARPGRPRAVGRPPQ